MNSQRVSVYQVACLLVLVLPVYAFPYHWEQMGPQGGYFKDFIVHPQDPQVIYAGSDDSGGLWKTTDGGQTWNLMTADWPDMTAWHIELDPSNPDMVYICDPYGRYGILKSEDGGQNWQQITEGLATQASRMVSRLVIASPDGDSLYISTGLDRYGDPPKPGDGIYKSVNGGLTWAAGGLQGFTALAICRCDDGSLLAGLAEQGLYRSLDGTTWTQVSSIPTDGYVWQLESMANVVVAAVNPYGIYLSQDYGASFEFSYSSYYTADLSIARVSPDMEIYACDFPGFIKYTASSGEWVDVVSPPLPNDLMIMGATAEEDFIYCGAFANSPIYVSENAAQSWSELPSSPQSGYFCGLAVDSSDPDRIFAANLGSYTQIMNLPSLSRTTDGGQTWSRLGPEAHCLFVHFSPGSSDIMYCGTFRKGAYRSDDGFSTWQVIREGDKIVFDLAVNDDDPSVLLLSEWDIEQSTLGVYRSTDSGGSFELVLQEVCPRLLHVTQSDTFYAASTQGLYISTDQGQSWILRGLSSYNLMSLEWNEGNLFTGTETGEIFRVTATSIEDISGNWEKPVNVADLLFVGDVLYAGLNGAEVDTTFVMHGGVWQTPDLGNTWENITGNLPVDNVYGNSPMALCGSALLTSTYGGGIHRLDDFQQIESPDSGAGSVVSGLSVSPNPSFGSVEIIFTIPVDSRTDFSVYDISGRVLNRSSRNYNRGQQSLFLNGLQPGLYFVRVLTPEFVTISRFVVL
ncbi:MAG: T9SS type A sorting domain-containing protein [Candidatus Aegiribacteria sp.]|nr:T9SS type A sorting domain-containing protein [Candidatus Aegiribacteria sp.]